MFDIYKEVEKMFDQMLLWRRDFHRHPELAYNEIRTSGIVAAHLRSLGLDVTEHVGKTGVVGLLHGEGPGKVLAMRADMDALPIMEATGFEFSSENPGVMHACGHDGHTAMLMAVATILTKHKDQIKGTIKFIFQPAEEGGRGANAMVRDGVLAHPRPDAIMAAHMMFQEAGTITVRKGYAFLASDTFCIKIYGQGGHGCKPHECTDTLLAACKIVMDIQMIVARKISPQDVATVSVGTIHSGTKENIIPGYAELTGTVRTLRPEVRQRVIEGLHEVCRGVCACIGTTYQMEYEQNCAPVYNDPGLMGLFEDAIKDVLGEDKVYEAELSRPGSEDFSAYLQDDIPGGYLWVGGAYPDEENPSKNHQPTYNWDENAMKAGAAAQIASALAFLDSWK